MEFILRIMATNLTDTVRHNGEFAFVLFRRKCVSCSPLAENVDFLRPLVFQIRSQIALLA